MIDDYKEMTNEELADGFLKQLVLFNNSMFDELVYAINEIEIRVKRGTFTVTDMRKDRLLLERGLITLIRLRAMNDVIDDIFRKLYEVEDKTQG